jgi:hypothetical protein
MPGKFQSRKRPYATCTRCPSLTSRYSRTGGT